MQLVFDHGETERIEKAHSQVHTLFTDDDAGKEFYLKIRVTNPAIADTIISGMLHGKLPSVDPGFNITEVNFGSILSRSQVKDELIRAIDNILGM